MGSSWVVGVASGLLRRTKTHSRVKKSVESGSIELMNGDGEGEKEKERVGIKVDG